jgi:hypothetical protein
MLCIAVSAIAKEKQNNPKKLKDGITIEYDRFRDQTTVKSAEVRLLEAGHSRGHIGEPFSLMAFYVCAGELTSCKESPIVLAFVAHSSLGWRWIDLHDVIMLSGSQRWIPLEVEWNGYAEIPTESVVAFYDSTEFLKMLEAPELEGKVGMDEFQINAKERAKLDAFADMLRNASREP